MTTIRKSKAEKIERHRASRREQIDLSELEEFIRSDEPMHETGTSTIYPSPIEEPNIKITFNR